MERPNGYFPKRLVETNPGQQAWLIHPFDEAQAQGPFSAPACGEGYVPLTTPRVQPGVPAQSFPLLDKIIEQKIPVELKCSRSVHWYDIGKRPMRINGIKVVTPRYHPHMDQILPGLYDDVIIPKCVSGAQVGTLKRTEGGYFEFTPTDKGEPWARISIFDLETQIQIQKALIVKGGSRRKMSRRLKTRKQRKAHNYL